MLVKIYILAKNVFSVYSEYMLNSRKTFKIQVWDMVDCINTEVSRNIFPEVCCSKGKPGKGNVMANLD